MPCQYVFCERLSEPVTTTECHEMVLATRSNSDLFFCRQCVYGKFLQSTCPFKNMIKIAAEEPKKAFSSVQFAEILLYWHNKHAWAKTCGPSSLVSIAKTLFGLWLQPEDIIAMTKKSGLRYIEKNGKFFIVFDADCKTFAKNYCLTKP